MTTRDDAMPVLVPARMLNEYTYCPRLMYLEWVQGDFVDSADTVDGRHQHRRVDRASGALQADVSENPCAIGGAGGAAARDGGEARSRRDRGWPRDARRLQARCSAGYAGASVGARARAALRPGAHPRRERLRVQSGVLYFVAAKQRVVVPFDDALRARTRELLAAARRLLRTAWRRHRSSIVPSARAARSWGSAFPTRSTCCVESSQQTRRASRSPAAGPRRRAAALRAGGGRADRQARRRAGRGEARRREDGREVDGDLAGRRHRSRADLDAGGAGALHARHPRALPFARRLVLRHDQRHDAQERRAASLPISCGGVGAGLAADRAELRRDEDPQLPDHAAPKRR